MTEGQLQAIKERANEALSGPWEVQNDNEGTEYHPFWVIGHAQFEGGDHSMELHVGEKVDAEFIAHAREDVPALIAEVERLREENKMYTKTILDDTYDEFVHVQEIKKLREALEFYASNSNNLRIDRFANSAVMQDEGEIARQALGGESNV